MRRLLCFGDSNTYGHDPCFFLGGRYAADTRWTGLLGADYEVINAGQNGRTIPARPLEYAGAEELIRELAPLDAFLVMLGTNDLLCSETADEAIQKMRRFLEAVTPSLGNAKVMLIAPPHLRPGSWVTEREQIDRSIRFGTLCRSLARELGIFFADAGAWEPELAFDGVHLSEAGHQIFAQGLKESLALMLYDDRSEP